MEKILPVSIKDIAIIGQELWFVSHECDALYRYNIQKGYIDYMTWIPSEVERGNMYSAIVASEKYLVLIPYNEKSVAIFDTEQLQFEKIELPSTDARCRYRKNAKFYSGLQSGEQVYLLPGEFPEILSINMNKKEIVSVNEWYPLYGRIPYPAEKRFGAYKGIDQAFYLNKTDLFISFFADDKGRIGKLDLPTGEMEIYELDGVDSYISCMECWEKFLILVTRPGDIVYWDMQSLQVTEICPTIQSEELEDMLSSGNVFSQSILQNNQLYLFFEERTKYIIFDLKKRTFECHDFNEVTAPVRKIFAQESYVYMITTEMGKFYEIENGLVIERILNLDKSALLDYYCNAYQEKRIINENKIFSLEHMVESLDEYEIKKVPSGITVGAQIYDFIKNTLK